MLRILNKIEDDDHLRITVRAELQASILLATDVASHDSDIPNVDLVINYDIPRNPRDYVPRVGSTVRADRGGLSVSFVSQVS
ncbi:hypothetical protein Q3G72_004503 [Acer saccharum]|nr:hypothetical protein Q3G72_004503 [Acer saccharum]